MPERPAEFDASRWAQFFLKFILAHPAVTAATPSTSEAEHMPDHLGGAMDRLPDAAARRRMVQTVDALPTV